MSSLLKMNLEIFGENDKDFFTSAYKESYNIGEEVDTPSEPIEAIDNSPNSKVDETIVDSDKTPIIPSNNLEEKPKELTPKEIKELYEQYYGQTEISNQNETNQEYDEQTKSALELYKYLEENPHLVQAMREIDQSGYQKLNNYVPDELTRKMQQFEEYIEEQKFNAYVNELKSKYNDFDEEKVIKFAEENEVYNLEIAYKALKSEQPNVIDEKALREQIKKELLEELKQNSLSTQTIIGTHTEKPIVEEKPSLTARQSRIASAMGMTAEEYAKWI